MEEAMPVVVQEDPEPREEPTSLIRLGIERNLPAEQLERILAVAERMAAAKAAEAFNHALAAFQEECPAIEKTTESGQFMATRNGVKRPARYAELDQIAATIRPHLHKHGLSYNFDATLAADGKLTVVCKLRHTHGHIETATFTAPTGSNAGASEVQKHASALTYGKRYALTSVLGLTTCDTDTDGEEPMGGDLGPVISVDQVQHIENLIVELKQDRQKFLNRCKAQLQVDRFEDIPAKAYGKVLAALEQKRRP